VLQIVPTWVKLCLKRVNTLTKKIINNGNAAVAEMLDDILSAHPQLRRAKQHTRAIITVDGPRKAKVGRVIGGGSGHEPVCLGFVGKVFAWPPPDPIMASARGLVGSRRIVHVRQLRRRCHEF
jgi:dihydroxyacetone kinase-like protein